MLLVVLDLGGIYGVGSQSSGGAVRTTDEFSSVSAASQFGESSGGRSSVVPWICKLVVVACVVILVDFSSLIIRYFLSLFRFLSAKGTYPRD